MSKHDRTTIGYLAVHSTMDVLCDGDACIIAGRQSVMHKYLEPTAQSASDFQIRKTNFGEVLEGLSRGGAYAFDEKSYNIFYPLANKSGLNLQKEQFLPTEKGNHFVIVKVIT